MIVNVDQICLFCINDYNNVHNRTLIQTNIDLAVVSVSASLWCIESIVVRNLNIIAVKCFGGSEEYAVWISNRL